jgi:NAD(P)H dehydrogenase (quinone)
MRVAIVFDHPYTASAWENIPHARSFSAAVCAAAIRGLESGGHQTDLIDLAGDGFNPVMSREDLIAWRAHAVIDPQVLDYQRRIALADHLAFVFPIWWESMPAPTKGFLDRVLTKEFAFRELADAKGNPFVNLLTNLRGVSLHTVMTTPHAAYRWWFGDPVRKILFKGTFGKIGVKNLRWMNYASVTEKSSEQRQHMLEQTERYFAALGQDTRMRSVRARSVKARNE